MLQTYTASPTNRRRATKAEMQERAHLLDPPPSEWSDLKYGLGTLQEDRDGEQTTYA